MRGGYGGYTNGVIKLQSNQNLYIYVGQLGSTTYQRYSSITYTFNGGGTGGSDTTPTESNGCVGAFGGGATDIRTISGNWNSEESLRSRIIVSGAGAGSSQQMIPYWFTYGGNSGGLTGYEPSNTGQDTASRESAAYRWGTGGTQNEGGTAKQLSKTLDHGKFGYGGIASYGGETNIYTGGGGGSGWYGGGGGRDSHGGGGGSSYISGHTGSVGVTSTSSSNPKSGCTTGTTNNACSITPYINPATGSGYTFTNTVMIDGAGYSWTNTKGSLQQMPNPNGGYYASSVGHSGNGAARITYLGTSI